MMLQAYSPDTQPPRAGSLNRLMFMIHTRTQMTAITCSREARDRQDGKLQAGAKAVNLENNNSEAPPRMQDIIARLRCLQIQQGSTAQHLQCTMAPDSSRTLLSSCPNSSSFAFRGVITSSSCTHKYKQQQQ